MARWILQRTTDPGEPVGIKPQITFDVHAMFLLNRPPTALATEFLKTLAKVIDTP